MVWEGDSELRSPGPSKYQKKKMNFLAKIVARLSYGERVEMLESKGAWVRVGLITADTEGWMHGSALTKKTIILRPGAEDVSLAASSDEIALAGKGFNRQVEGEFRTRNPDIDFSWIDRMERMSVTPEQMREIGIREFCAKPWRAKDLNDVIRNLLDRPRASRRMGE